MQKPASFPGAVGLTELNVYNWESRDGLHGGSPHVHLMCAECYVVVEGRGELHTLTMEGYLESPLRPGDVIWFQPGTIHRAVNTSGTLRANVVMGNGGLPEAGDAVMTLPPEHLASAESYAFATSILDADGKPSPQRARERRDLAVAGYQVLKQSALAGDFDPVRHFYRAAIEIVRGRHDEWSEILRSGVEAEAKLASARLSAISQGDISHLLEADVSRVEKPASNVLGMCGRLSPYDAVRKSLT